MIIALIRGEAWRRPRDLQRIKLPLLFNRFSVIVGMINYLISFVVFPVLASLLAIDRSIYLAAEIQGAKPPRIFFQAMLPLCIPGMAAPAFNTTVMSLGFFVVPALLGGRQDTMMSNLSDFFTREILDWSMESAIGAILLGIVTLCALGTGWFRKRETRAGTAALAFQDSLDANAPSANRNEVVIDRIRSAVQRDRVGRLCLHPRARCLRLEAAAVGRGEDRLRGDPFCCEPPLLISVDFGLRGMGRERCAADRTRLGCATFTERGLLAVAARPFACAILLRARSPP